MSERPTPAEKCQHLRTMWTATMNEASCKDCGAKYFNKEWHEANSTHAQEVEEQEVLNHIEALQLAAIKTDSNLARCYIDLSKLRDKNAATIAHLKEENAILYAEDKRMQAYNSEIYRKTEALSLQLRLLKEQDEKLQSELSEVRAREAMLYDALKHMIRSAALNNCGLKIADDALSASSTEVAKWTAEIRAALCDWLADNPPPRSPIATWSHMDLHDKADELRASASQQTIKEE